jgi:hypothetical protein
MPQVLLLLKYLHHVRVPARVALTHALLQPVFSCLSHLAVAYNIFVGSFNGAVGKGQRTKVVSRCTPVVVVCFQVACVYEDFVFASWLTKDGGPK